MPQNLYFQWQNEFLVKTIYPMREPKLRDFLLFYMEIDLWKQYKDKSIASLGSEVQAFTKARAELAGAAYLTYSTLSAYFQNKDVRADYAKFQPIDEQILAQINEHHSGLASNWPRFKGDVRREKSFVIDQEIPFWTQQRRGVIDWIKGRQRRLEAMAPDHPKRAAETKELEQKQNVSLPMIDHELDQLHAFGDSFANIEKRKLELFQAKQKAQIRKDQITPRITDLDSNIKSLEARANKTPAAEKQLAESKKESSDLNAELKSLQAALDTSEADYMTKNAPDTPPTIYDIVTWKMNQYKASLAGKNQYQLLDEIHQRFTREPKRYPLWLQYMVVHFSGMRYASAHGSWADPKDLLIRLRVSKMEKDLKGMDDAAVEKLSKEKVALYESAKTKLAQATDKTWKDKVAVNLGNLKSPGPKTRRFGLTSMQTDEITYEVQSMTTTQVLDVLRSMKSTFPRWAWKEIVRLTPLRVTEVADPNWEKLTPDEEQESYLPQNNDLRMLIAKWNEDNTTNWRDEHGRTHQLIVSRAVCNETAEHIQHLRGHLPYGGLTPKPKWYKERESANNVPGNPPAHFIKPKAAQDYLQGASILWLRFVNSEPNSWQIAEAVSTKDGYGLLPPEFTGRKPAPANSNAWTYKQGNIVTRARTVIGENNAKVNQQQWLRWIHEATVVEVADTADGTVVLTYETALPDDDRGTSSIGMFKKPLEFFLSDGKEDEYNRSFLGYVPEGQLPMNDLNEMLDWNKILPK